MGDDGMNYRWYKATPERRIVSSRGDNSDVFNEKIEQAILNVESFPLKHIIFQTWRPAKTTAGKRVLSCLYNPCCLEPHNARLCKYSLLCNKYYYDIEHDLEEGKLLDDPMTICGAPPSTAFLNRFPVVVRDLTLHRGTPLVDCALECELTCFMMLPVFDQTSCVGVIEVSMRVPRDLAVIYIELNHQLMRVGLCINPPKPLPPPWKDISIVDGKLAASEIDKALDMAIQSYTNTLAHVKVCYDFNFKYFWPQSRNNLALIKYLSSIQVVEKTKTSVGVKRKAIDLYNDPLTNINNLESEYEYEYEDEDEYEDDDEDLVILAIYKVDYKLFFLPVSASFEDVKEKLIRELELNPVGTYKIMYQVDPGEWYSLTDDTCLENCISSYQTSEDYNYHIKLGVLNVEK